MTIKRRAFLELSGAVGVGVALAGAGAPGAVGQRPLAALSESEMRLLKQLLARLLPADAESGGAVEACAHVYIDRALGGYHARHLSTYRFGLGAVAQLLGKSGKTSQEQGIDGLLAAMEAGKVGAAFEDGGKAFFALLRTHMLEGVFGDPAYGGNRDFSGWRLIGYPGVQLVVTADEQAVGGPSSTLNRSMERFGGKAVA